MHLGTAGVGFVHHVSKDAAIEPGIIHFTAGSEVVLHYGLYHVVGYSTPTIGNAAIELEYQLFSSA